MSLGLGDFIERIKSKILNYQNYYTCYASYFMTPIYQPAEDSYLMSRILKEQLPDLLEKNPELKFLRNRSWFREYIFKQLIASGIKKENIFSSDINQDSVSHCNILGFNCVYSDLFENIKGKFDLIIFNPPYLPEDSEEPEDSEIATTGGVKGNEIILRFLKEAKEYIEERWKNIFNNKSV